MQTNTVKLMLWALPCNVAMLIMVVRYVLLALLSTTAQARERQWEYQRRTATATTVAAFAAALANRNHAYREIGLYLALEARSQARVKQGIANVTEQVTLLEKLAAAQRNILTF